MLLPGRARRDCAVPPSSVLRTRCFMPGVAADRIFTERSTDFGPEPPKSVARPARNIFYARRSETKKPGDDIPGPCVHEQPRGFRASERLDQLALGHRGAFECVADDF